MAKINLCFLWHMHQPFYKDLVSGEYRLPWTRMHALKDYYGMVKILEEFPEIRQTFNLVPSMMVQVEEYARGEARDPFLAVALKPAEHLTPEDQRFILSNFFMANAQRMIHRYPRYGELFTAYQAQGTPEKARGVFGPQEFRDLQILSQVAWFDEEFHDKDLEVQALVAKGSRFSLEDQALMGRKQREILSLVIPQYKKLAESGQIEISTTPFYHPILPLLCDSDIATISHPFVPLPPRFCYPQDARVQMEMARDYIKKTFGVAPVGLWPSEGSVSDQVLQIAAAVGFEWAATDNGVLDRTIHRAAGPDVTYKPYLWSQQGRSLRMIFRDHILSDRIGFVYQGLEPAAAADDFLNNIRNNCRSMLAAGRDVLVPIILDGENAWEYYEKSGRAFFRELYSRIQNDRGMDAITVSEALRRIQAEPIDHIFPGSWINANFDIWIGAEEDNKSWKLLLEARQAYDRAVDVPEDRRRQAYEELLISEGSDWNWWYGPEHDSANRIEFDQIYREHLANVYRALGIAAPPELSVPILKTTLIQAAHTAPSSHLRANINGKVDSYFEWLGAGVYRLDSRQGAMHGKREYVRELHYGTGDDTLYLRVDFAEQPAEGLELQVLLRQGQAASIYPVKLSGGVATSDSPLVEAAYCDILEIAVKLAPSLPTEFQLSIWHNGLPVEAIPPQERLKVAIEEPGWWS